MSSFKGRFCEVFKKKADVKLIMLGIKYHPVPKKKIMSNSLTDLVNSSSTILRSEVAAFVGYEVHLIDCFWPMNKPF